MPIFAEVNRTGLSRVYNHHRPVAQDSELEVGAHHDSRRFVDANSNKLRLLEHDAEKAVFALARNKMLIDHGVSQEAKSIRGFELIALDGSKLVLFFGDAVFFAGNHPGAHDGCAGAGPGNDAPSAPQFLHRFDNACPGQCGDQSRLISARQIDAGCLLHRSGR